MQISASLRQQARMLIDVLINEAAGYIEEQPLGAFVPMGQINGELGGVGAMINMRAVQDRMRERGCSRSFYMCKGRNGSITGVYILQADALVASLEAGAVGPPRGHNGSGFRPRKPVE